MKVAEEKSDILERSMEKQRKENKNKNKTELQDLLGRITSCTLCSNISSNIIEFQKKKWEGEAKHWGTNGWKYPKFGE